MYHKVFINNREIAIVTAPLDNYTEVPKFLDIAKFYLFLAEDESIKEQMKLAVVDVDGKFWKAFKKAHKHIEAAGGLVINQADALLVIHRLGYWDLPKGKLEKGESPEIAALREVEEECGISDLNIIKQLTESYHTYEHKGKMVLKRTYWFLMNYRGTEKLIPQTEEDILEVRFMPEEAVKTLAMPNTYQSLLPLFNAYLLRNK